MDTTADTLQPAARFDTTARESTTTTHTGTGTSRKTRTLTFAGIGALLLAAAATSAFIYYGGRVSTDIPVKVIGKVGGSSLHGTLGSGGETLTVYTSGGGVKIASIGS